jgi:hypothetical protein
MYSTRQKAIVNKLFDFQGGKITQQQLNDICQDKAELHFAVGKLRGLNIRISNSYRTQSFGHKANEEFQRRKDLERELTIKRKKERQHKILLRTS